MSTPYVTDTPDGLTAKLEAEAAAWRRRRSARPDKSSTAGVQVVRVVSRAQRSREPVQADRSRSRAIRPD
jgi:hypothetical protein